MGVDYSHKLLTHNAESKLARMDALNMGFEDESFDVVFCSALLHHIEDVDKAIREFVRISRRYLVLVEPNALNPLMALFSCLVPEERGTLRFTPRYLKKRIQREGLHILANYSYGFDMPNRWPVSCLQIVRLLGFRHLLGTSRIIVAEKNTNTPRN
jgi:ubiquinone/menaquinone biosynthesis C-methylase UbiE